MANVTVTSTQSNINVSSTPSNITVTDLDSNNQINVTQTNTTITVGSTVSNVIVSNVAPVSNADVRTKISVQNVSGYGNLAYDNSITSNGVIQYTGISNSDIITIIDDNPANVRQHISVTDTGGDGSLSYSNTTGVITYTGPSAAEVRAHISNTAPVLYDATTGVISLDTDAVFSNTLANNWFTTQTTDNLTEGTTNLYYTNSRVRTTMSNTLVGGSNITITPDLANNIITIDADLTGDITGVTAGSGLTGGGTSGDVTLNVGAGTGITVNADNVAVDMTAFTTDNLAEGNTNLYYTQARFDSAFSGKTTTDLAEGTNLYYTNARANAAFVDSLDNITVPIVSTANITTTANVQGATLKGTGAVGLVVTGNATIGGNLDVTGNINSETVVDLFVEDRNITMQYGQTAGNVVPSANSQIFIDRGTEANTYLIWSEADDKWGWSNDGTNVIFFAETTDGLVEGSTNLYFTNARANAAFVDSLDNITVPIISTANITTTSNVQGSWFIGNVSGTTADFTGNVTAGNIVATSVIDTTANITTTANIQGDYIIANAFVGGTFTGDGSDLADVRAESVEVTLKNADTVTIPKGYPVHATGYSGSGEVECVLADASNADLMPAHFIAQEELTSTGDTGRGILAGRIQNVDTSTFSIGDTIYVAVGGGYANVAPTGEGNLIQNLGIVTRIDASVGGGEVMGAGRTAATPNLDEGNIFLGSSSNTAITVTPDTNFDTTANTFSLSNTLTDVNSITSESASGMTLKGQTGGIDIDKTISSTATRILDLDTDGYSVSDADFGSANVTTDNTKNMYTTCSGTSGTNTLTASTMHAAGLYAIGQSGTGYTDYSAIGYSTLQAALGVFGANLKGWILFEVGGTTTTLLSKLGYVTGISGSTITLSENLKKTISNAGVILLPGAFSTTQNIGFSISNDSTLSTNPFSHILPRFNDYTLPETLSNVTLDAVSYGDATVDMANVVMRHSADLLVGSNDAVRTERLLMIGANATPDVLSIGIDDVLPGPTALGVTLENDGLTFANEVNTAPQTKFLINQFNENGLNQQTTYPLWTEFLGESGDANVDMKYLGAPQFNFKMLGGSKTDKKPVKSSEVVGRIGWNTVIPNVTGGADVFHPPASIVARAPGDPDAPANLTLANVDMHFQSTYATSYRNGSDTTLGTIPRTFLSSSDGNTIIAAKSDGKITLRPNRDYGDTGTATSYVENRFAHELHNYHEFLGASFANTTAKTGTLVEIQSKSGETGGSTDFNYDSKGDAILRLSTHLANGDVSAYWDINNDITAGNLTISKDGTDRLVLEDSNIHVTNNVHAQYFLGNTSGTTASFTDLEVTNINKSGANVTFGVGGGSPVYTRLLVNGEIEIATTNPSGNDTAITSDSGVTFANVTANNNINASSMSTTGVDAGANAINTGTLNTGTLEVDLIKHNTGTPNIECNANILFSNSSSNFGITITGNNGVKANTISLFSSGALRSSDVIYSTSGIENLPFARSWDTYAATFGVSGQQTRYDGDANIILSTWTDSPTGRLANTGLKINNLFYRKDIAVSSSTAGNWHASNIATLSSEGFAVSVADAGNAAITTKNVPGLLVSANVVAGSNVITLSPFFSTAFFGKQTTATTYTASWLFGADAETALGTLADATGNGWTFYNVTSGFTTTNFDSQVFSVGISGNQITMSANATASYVGTGILFPGMHKLQHLNGAGTDNDDSGLHFSLSGDTSNTSIPFTHISPIGQRFTQPKEGNNALAGGNYSVGSTDYNSYESSTVTLANVEQRHILDISTDNQGSAVRIPDGALLIGRTATPDVVSGGNAITTEASIEGITVEHDGLTTFSGANTTPQTKFLINQYSDNSVRDLATVPNWASSFSSGNDTEDLLNLGAPAFNFKYLNGNKNARNNLAVTANTIVGKIQWNPVTSATGKGSDVIYPPAAITVRVPEDQTQTGANSNIAATDFYAQSTYRTSYRNGTTNATGGIPRTFLASKAGNTIIAAKTDGRIALKPVRDYGDAGDATSYVENRFPHSTHDYHTFLSAEFANTTSKAGTIVTIQPDSGETGGSTDFNYDSKGNAVLRFQTHLANNDPRYNFDIVHDEANEKLFIESGVANQQHIEISSAGKVSMKQVMRMHPLSNSAILALTGNELGDMVVSSDANKICFYNGTNWVTIDTNTVIV